MRARGRGRRAVAVGMLAAGLFVSGGPAGATPTLVRVSQDPYTDAGAQHGTEVEPDTFSYGNTVVGAFQVGRFGNGGSTNIGWATSTDSGSTWVRGFLSGVTKAAGGTYDRATDPSVAYDAAHGVWLVNALAMTGTTGTGIVVNRSTDGALTFGGPVTVARAPGGGNYDKNWIVCDDTSASPFYGHCYVEWDDNAAGDRIWMSTSTDGGLTWSAPTKTTDGSAGFGGQPVVRPDGTVVVPMSTPSTGAVKAFRSTDGGVTWSAPVRISPVHARGVRGQLRAPRLPSADVDAAGTVYVVWRDCRFRPSCRSNDIVLTTSSDGLSWSPVSRVPIDDVSSTVDHFIPGVGVDHGTAGATAHLGLTYFYYPTAACSVSTCQLFVGFVGSSDGGVTWGAPVTLGGPMGVTWLADTSEGYMVGDYVSTSFAAGKAHTVVPVAQAPAVDGTRDEAMYAVVGGL